MLIRRGVQHVVVEDCHITGWGRIGGARSWGVTTGIDSGIYAENDAGHLIIQRNLIEYPRGGSTSGVEQKFYTRATPMPALFCQLRCSNHMSATRS